MVNYKKKPPNYLQVRGQCPFCMCFGNSAQSLQGATGISHPVLPFPPQIAFSPKMNKEYSMKTLKVLGNTTQTSAEALNINSSYQYCLFDLATNIYPASDFSVWMEMTGQAWAGQQQSVHICLKNMGAACFPKSTGEGGDICLPKPGKVIVFLRFGLSTTHDHFLLWSETGGSTHFFGS